MSISIEDIEIRPEQESDFTAIHNIVCDAFADAEHSDGDEQDLVDRIRLTPDYIPHLSLVGVINGKIVGYLMMSKIKIGNVTAIALAPLAVHPEYQRQGVGSKLINTAHNIAAEYGYSISVVLGSPDYYSKFGYENSNDYGVFPPFDVPAEYFMIHRLDNTSPVPTGTVIYSSAFNI